MQPLIEVKQCNKCSVIKPLTEYYPNKSCSLGVVGTCRQCSRDSRGNWYSENRERRQEAANTRNQVRKLKAILSFGDRCADCEKSFPACVYQFHHLDPTQKDVNPSYAMAGSEETMWKELKKCVMLCANCHMIRHHGRN